MHFFPKLSLLDIDCYLWTTDLGFCDLSRPELRCKFSVRMSGVGAMSGTTQKIGQRTKSRTSRSFSYLMSTPSQSEGCFIYIFFKWHCELLEKLVMLQWFFKEMRKIPVFMEYWAKTIRPWYNITPISNTTTNMFLFCVSQIFVSVSLKLFQQESDNHHT